MGAREKQFNFRLSPDEDANIQEVMTHYGLDASSVVRMLLKQERDCIRARKEVAVLGLTEHHRTLLAERDELRQLIRGVLGLTASATQLRKLVAQWDNEDFRAASDEHA